MAAITTLSTLSASRFRGARRLADAKSDSLVVSLNTIIAKVNAVIARWNVGTLDTLAVGSGTGVYYGSSNSWLTIDGTNPPTLAAFRIQNQANGAFVTVTYDSGAGGFQFA